jgi:hypothetical protein
MRLVVVCLMSSVALLTPRSARAQMYETVGVRAQGLGGAFVAVADDATATWWNPAGIATGPYFDALIEYDRIRTSPQRSVKGVAVAFPALGVSYYHLPINYMRAASPTESAAPSRQDQGAVGVYGLTFGQSVGAHLVFASTVKAARAGDTHTDLDLGGLAKFGPVQLGLTVKNVREPTFDGERGTFVLDRQTRAGAALIGHSNGLVSALTLAVDGDLTATATERGEVRHVAGGLEAWLFGRKLGLRAGASGNTVGTKGSSASGGVSVVIASGAYVTTYLDAQYTNGSDESRRSWGVAMRATF